MSTNCAKCKKTMDAAPYSKEHNALVCGHCGYLLRIETLRGKKGADQQESGGRLQVPLPKGVTLSGEKGALVIRTRWFEKSYLILALFTLLFDGALALWYTSLFGLDAVGINFYSLSPVLHLVTAALLSWYTLACLFNSTVIRVTNEEITVRNSPFWWFGNIHLLPRQLDQLWSERQEKVSGEPLFHVKGMLRNNRVFPLIYGLQNPSQALYIEQEIEKYCNIKDRKVPGEM